MAQPLSVPAPDARSGLEERLRASLQQARGNPEIRRQLERLARDPERLAPLERALGPGHALMRELRRLSAV